MKKMYEENFFNLIYNKFLIMNFKYLKSETIQWHYNKLINSAKAILNDLKALIIKQNKLYIQIL